MQVKKFVFNPFQENTYVVFDETQEAVIIDPGCYESFEEKELFDFIDQNQLTVKHLLNTHCHIDHVLGNQAVAQKYSLIPKIHQKDLVTLESVDSYCHLYGFNNYKSSPKPEFIDENDTIQFGNSEFKILFGPGHCPGHIAFYSEKEHFMISGDILFQGSFGRVDLPGGDFHTLKDSILNTFFKLPDETVVFCGHGPETSIGIEKASNPMNHL
ncbi:MAG: MBL fold metallo-hydrolase [Crocinitomicaceae bacterium]|nr:MBL fold metallo-hydrolase [Crocinitomicaceae bacterium]